MKTFRFFTALLVVALSFPPAFSQETSEFASLLAKARRGNGIAQYNLGLAYAEGKGTAVDPMEAFVWLSLARENGARGRALDTLMGDLDKKSLELAQRRLAERKAELGVRTPTTVNVRTTTATPAPTETPPPAPPRADDILASLKAERDTLTARLAAVSADVTALRAERERIMGLSAGHEKAARTATEANLALQEQTRVAVAKAAELTLANDTAKGELARVRLALTAAQKGAKAAPDTTALEQKTRELQAALTELETARTFGQQVENTLNTVTNQKSALESTLRAAEAARDSYAREFETTKAQIAQLENQARLTATAAAKPAAPTYPDLSGRVAELEAQLVVARQPTTPAYPNLSGKVTELETKVANLTAETTRAKQETTALTQAKEAAERSLAAKPAAPAYPDLSGRVADLQTQLAQAKSAAPAYPDMRPRVTEMETVLASLSAEAARAKQEAATLAKAKDDATQKAAALTQSSETSLRTLSLELAAAKAALAKANDSLNAKPVAPAYPDLSGKVTELEAKLAALSSEATRAKQETAALAKAKDDAMQKAATSELAHAEALKQFEDYKSTTATVQRERTTLIANVKMLESDKASLRRQVESAGTEATQLRNQVATQKEQLSALSSVADRAKQEAAALTKAKEDKPAAPAYPDLSGKVAELDATLRDTAGQLAAASAEADRAKQQTAALNQSNESSIRSLTLELAAAKVALAKASDSLNAKPAAPAYPDLSGKVTELEATLRNTTGQLAASTGRIKELEAQHSALQATLAAKPIAPTYPDLSPRVAELEAQLAKSRNPVAPAYPDLSGRVAELTKEVTQLRDDRERMQKMLAETGRQMRNSTADASRIKELETQAAGLQNSLAAAQAQTTELQAALARKPAAPAYPDLSGRVTELESALAARPAAPAYPNLTGRVAELEAQLSTAAKRPNTPSYPDLSNRVSELEATLASTSRQLKDTREQLAQAASQPAVTVAAPVTDTSVLEKRLAETEGRLTTALRGYALLEKDRDAQQSKSVQARDALANEKNSLAAQVTALTAQVEQLQSATAAQAEAERAAASLTAEKDALNARLAGMESRATAAQAEAERLGESLAALQRSTGQSAGDTASARALVSQLQGANAVLAQENYQLKTMLARTTGNPPAAAVAAVASQPAASRTHVVAAGDTLTKISQRYYGTAGRWQEIFNANSDRLGTSGVLRVGIELRIP